MQNADLFFSKCVSFNVNVLRVRNLDLAYFINLRKQILGIGGIPIIASLSKQARTFFKPWTIAIQNFGDEEKKLIKANYRVCHIETKELLFELNVDFYYDDTIRIENSKYSFFRCRDLAGIPLDDLLRDGIDASVLHLKFNNLPFKKENVNFSLRSFVEKESQVLVGELSDKRLPVVAFIFSMDKNNPLNDGDISIYTSTLKHDILDWSAVRPGISRKFIANVVNNDNKFILYSSNFKLIKAHFSNCECAAYAHSILTKTEMLRSLPGRPETPKSELDILIENFAEYSGNSLQGRIEFASLVKAASLGADIVSKEKMFEKVINSLKLRSTIPYKKFTNSSDFLKAYDMFLRVNNLKIKPYAKNFAFFALQRYFEKVSAFYGYFNDEEWMFYYFILFPNSYKSLIDPKLNEEIANKNFLSSAFMKVVALKAFLKNSLPNLYCHILRLGSSIEDLFVYDLVTNFVDSFKFNFLMNILDFYVIFENFHAQHEQLTFLLDILVIEQILKQYEWLLLKCKSNNELISCKLNIFKFFDWSSSNMRQNNFFQKLMSRYFGMFSPDLTDRPEDFTVNYRVFIKFIKIKQAQVTQDYQEVYYKYYTVKEVERFFNEVKFNERRRRTELSKQKAVDLTSFAKDEAFSEEGTSFYDEEMYDSNENDEEFNFRTQVVNSGVETSFFGKQQFVPFLVKFSQNSSNVILRLHIDSINSYLFERETTSLKNTVLLEGYRKTDRIFSISFDLNKAEFINKDSYFEIPMVSLQELINLRASFKSFLFEGTLKLDLMFTNSLESCTVCLLNPVQGQIWANLTFAIQSPNSNISRFEMIDISEPYCIDRLARSNKVYRKTSVAELNSLVQRYYIEFDLKPHLEQISNQNNCFTFAISEIKKYFTESQNTFPLLKLLLYLIINSTDEDEKSLSNKLDLLWNAVMYFEDSDQFMSHESVCYIVESIFINCFPFITPYVFQNYADRLFCGYVGRCIKATLLDQDKESLADVTSTVNDLIIQYQIFMTTRIINFADPNFLLHISKVVNNRLSSGQVKHLSFLKLELHSNNSKRIIVIPMKMQFNTEFDYLRKKNKLGNYINLENNFYVDKETFKKALMNDPLICFLLQETREPSNYVQKVREKLLCKLNGMYVECREGVAGQGQNLGDIDLKGIQLVYLNGNKLNPYFVNTEDIIG